MLTQCRICGKEREVYIMTLLCDECDKNEVKEKHSYYYEGGIDPIGVGEKILTKEEMNGFYKMNILKYSMRAGKKEGNTAEQDMEKIEFYRKKLEENK